MPSPLYWPVPVASCPEVPPAPHAGAHDPAILYHVEPARPTDSYTFDPRGSVFAWKHLSPEPQLVTMYLEIPATVRRIAVSLHSAQLLGGSKVSFSLTVSPGAGGPSAIIAKQVFSEAAATFDMAVAHSEACIEPGILSVHPTLPIPNMAHGGGPEVPPIGMRLTWWVHHKMNRKLRTSYAIALGGGHNGFAASVGCEKVCSTSCLFGSAPSW